MTHDAHSIGSSRVAWLMIWETDTRKMNGVQEIKVNSKTELSAGDNLRTTQIAEKIVDYEIKEILNKRPSSISGMDYYTLKAERKLLRG